MKQYEKSNIEATVIDSKVRSTIEPYALIHINKNGISYTSWKALNNEVAGYALRQSKGFDFNQNRGFVGPLMWHQTLIWDKLFSNEYELNGYECSILGRTRLAGKRVTLLRLTPVDSLRYSYIISKDVDTGLPVELSIYAPGQGLVLKLTATSMGFASDLNLNVPDETFDRVEKLKPRVKTDENHVIWPELTIPKNFSFRYQEVQKFGDEEVPFQVFSDGLTEFRVYKNSRTSMNIGSATDGSLNVVRKNSRMHEYAVVGEIPLELCSIILSKISEYR